VEVENKVTFIKSDYANENSTLFDQLLRSYDEENNPGAGTESHTITLSSEPVDILVKALPDTGRPPSFNGAVGNFEVTASLDKSTLAANEMATVRVMISGKGNLPVVNSPEVNLPDGFEKYELKVDENINKFEAPIGGDKVFEYRFSPRKKGSYIIPSVEFSFFNPRTRTFQKSKTDSLVLQVSAPVIAAKTRQLEKYEASVQEEEGWWEGFVNSKWVWGVPILAFAGIGIYRNSRTKKKSRQISDALSTEDKVKPIIRSTSMESPVLFHPGPFGEAHRILMEGKNGNLFYEELARALWQYFGDRFRIRPSALNQNTVTEHLQKAGFDETVVDQFHLLINQCEWALYTPQHNESDMQSAFDLAEDLIQCVNLRP